MGDADSFQGLARAFTSLGENAAKLTRFVQGDGHQEVFRSIREVREKPSKAGAELGKMYRTLNDNNQAWVSCILRGVQTFKAVVGKADETDYDKFIGDMKRNSEAAKPMSDKFSNNVADTALQAGATRFGKAIYERFRGEQPRVDDDLLECRCCGGLREKQFGGSRDNPNMEDIGTGEATVAQNLRSLCTSYGEEQTETLLDTSKLLLKLGKVYLHKAACETRGILQKLSFIRCFALLHGARVRLESLKRTGGETELADVGNALVYANSQLLNAIGSKGDPLKLNNAPQYSLLSLAVERAAVDERLKAFDEDAEAAPTTNNEDTGERQVSFRRIEKMKQLNGFMTEKYIKLVQNIAMKCLFYLGAPPVRFTIVGLGSMARREITLFSDFEHVILLEEGHHSYETLEYFRWFTVLFQTIMIGIGETIVPSLCVRSINNLYSNKKSEDCWFHDIFTRCGVAFDGMAPLSCATPLGRQIVDERCPIKIELIKTVSEMLVYLVPEPQTCSDYERNLKQMLSSTCFVFGDEQLYEEFREGGHKIIRTENRRQLAEESASVVTQNRSAQIRDGYYDVGGQARLDQKISYYRPFTLMVACLGKINDVIEFETFRILDELKRKNAINSLLHYRLTYAFAVICEMRVRAYGLAKAQRKVIFLRDLRRLIGEEAEWICKDMMQWLRDSITKYADTAFPDLNQSYASDCPKNEVRKLYFSGQYEEAVEIGTQHGTEDVDITLVYWLFKSCYQAGLSREKRVYWDKLESMYENLIESQFTSRRERADCCCIMADVYESRNEIGKAYEVSKNWLCYYLKGSSLKQNRQAKELAEQYQPYLLAAHAELRPGGEEMPEFLDKLLSGGMTDCTSTLRYLRYVIHGAASQDEGLRDASWLAGLADDIRSRAREINEPRKLLKVIWALQINNQRWTDALRTVDYIKEFPDIPCSEADHRASDEKGWPVLSISCAAAEFIHTLAKGLENLQRMQGQDRGRCENN